MGGPAGAFAGAVTGGFGYAYPTDKNASGFAAPSGHATALLGGGGGAERGDVPSIFGLESIEKAIEHMNPATFEMPFSSHEQAKIHHRGWLRPALWRFLSCK